MSSSTHSSHYSSVLGWSLKGLHRNNLWCSDWMREVILSGELFTRPTAISMFPSLLMTMKTMFTNRRITNAYCWWEWLRDHTEFLVITLIDIWISIDQSDRTYRRCEAHFYTNLKFNITQIFNLFELSNIICKFKDLYLTGIHLLC